MTGPGAHWEAVWRRRPPETVSWYEAEPARSLAIIESVAADRAAAIVDVGGGASLLVDRLLDAGYRDLTVLDVSGAAIERARARVGRRARAATVCWVVGDATDWRPDRRFEVWHDRAVFHFLVDGADRRRYVAALRSALRPSGHAVLATFGPDGPTTCSGLPTRRYSAAGLAAELGDGFVLQHAELAVHVTPTGAEQQFQWAVFQRVLEEQTTGEAGLAGPP